MCSKDERSVLGSRDPFYLVFLPSLSASGKIYVTGGVAQGTSDSVCVAVYDPQADAWTQLAKVTSHEHRSAEPRLRSGGRQAKRYVFGGHGTGRELSTAEVYDPASNSWAQGLSLTSPRDGLVAVAF